MNEKKLKKMAYAGSALAGATALAAGAAHAQGFDGPYAGVSFGHAYGGNPEAGYPGSTYKFDGNAAGAFFGVNASSGGITYGAEISYDGTYTTNKPGGYHYRLKDTTTISAKVGKAIGNTLVYGSVGMFSGRGDYVDSVGGGYNKSASGKKIALGAEYNIRKNFFVGGEVEKYFFDMGQNFGPPGFDSPSPLEAVSVRAGLRF